MQTIFSGHTQGRLAELIAPKKYLHGFGTAAVPVRELIAQKRCLHSFVSVVLLALVFIFVQNACVSEVSAASMTLTVPAAITLDVQPTGTFAKSSASSFSAKTDGAWGYNLSIKAKSTTDMVNGSAKLAAISKNMTELEYQAAGNNNTWGFIPSKLDSEANSSYIPASTSDSTIEKTSAANASAATSYSITLGAKADNTLAKGTYSNTMILTLSANTVNYSITYNCNSGTSCPAAQTGSTTGSTVPLSSAKPTRDGFEFQGWCPAEVTGNETAEPSCSGKTWQLGNAYTLTNGSNTVTMNAMWKATKEELLTQVVKVDSGVTSLNFKVGNNIEMIMVAEQNSGGTNYYKPHYAFSGIDITGLPTAAGRTLVITVVPKPGYKLSSLTKSGSGTQTWTATGTSGKYKLMKDVSQAECLAAGTEGMNVTDERNNVSYTIGKFSDKCWMFSNLRLASGTTLNSTTSAVSSNFTLPTTSWTSSSQNYYNGAVMKECKGVAGYNASGTGKRCADQSSGVTEYYYNWYAATANPNNGTNTSSSTQSEDNKSLGSICPKNWRLMTSDSLDELATFASAWNADEANNPGRLVASGAFSSATQDSVGWCGYWWSSSRYSDSGARAMSLNSGSINRSGSNKYAGYSVRCVAREKTMQTVNEWGSSLGEEEVVEAVDERDGNKYKVAKLKDGKIWMVENLKLGRDSSMTLTSSDSDVASSFTLPASSTSGFSVFEDNVNNIYVDETWGGYYTWFAATAGEGTRSMSSGNVSHSICPKGWRLPTGASSGEFQALYNKYNSSALMRGTPVPAFVLSGYYSSSSSDYQGSDGYYWSSTAYSSDNAYRLRLYSSGVDPANSISKGRGLSVRCVAR